MGKPRGLIDHDGGCGRAAMLKVQGACHCGAIRFEAEVDAERMTLCHCADCQRLSGGPYRATVPAPAETFRLTAGTPRSYIKTADSGAQRRHAFCRDCGTPIYATTVETPRSYSLRIGTLDQRRALTPKRQIWRRSALPWCDNLEGVPIEPGT